MIRIIKKLSSSLVGKSILFISTFLIVTIFIMTFIFIARYKGEMFVQLKKHGVSIANNFSYNAEYGLLVEDTKGLGELIDGVMKEDDIAYVIVLDKTGKVVVSSKKGIEKDALGYGVKLDDLKIAEEHVEQWVTLSNEQVYDISVPIITVKQDSSGMFGMEDVSAAGGREEKIGMVKVGISRTSTIKDIGSTTGIIIFIAIIMLLVSNVILMYFVNGTLGPVKIVASAAHAIAKGDLSQDIVIKKAGNDEIGQLSKSFTKMIEVLRESEKIKESEQILDAAASAMRIIDLEGTIMKVNKTMASVTGLSKEDSIGKKCHEVMSSPFCKTENCPIFKVQDNYREMSIEIEHDDKDGKKRIYLMSAMPFYNNLGEIVGVIEDMRDITELKVSEEQIRNTSEELTRAITEYFEVLDRIGAGDPDARASEKSSLEIVSNLGKSINQTAVNMAEFIKQFNELAINITEKFQVIQQVSRGDLTVSASEDTGDELMMKMGQVLNQMIKNLRKLITDVSAHAALVTQSASSLSEISDQSTDTISQLSSTMQQISESTNLVATSSQRASTSSASADKASREGRKLMNLLLEKMQVIQVAIDTATSTMHELETRSEKISEIVQVITKIADQTNLLSLNAAIEAARAGEAGRGFAVVADEVRKLAESSTYQAQQISSIIQEVVTNTQLAVERVNVGLTEVQKGRDLVDSAHEMFIQVADNIETVANQVEGIAGAAEESAASAEQATAGAEEQNASIEEISASSTELFEGSKKVQEALKMFKLQ